ncbi:MAG TPA: molybdate ABC transporter substrate-binding protein [Thermoanaerobaculia bacterium]|jgi:molybdate transport system substrate-binding protein|nr:molybdate ABC transporter substrate-binding protein [Thermoanaerobaculia bacterium]
MPRLLLLLLLAFPLAAAEVRVFAAASLTDALNEIGAAYEKASGDRIVFNFGASSMLARQIQQGAPADLFLSADEEKMNALAQRGLVATRTSVLSNTLAIVVPRVGGRAIGGPRQLASVASLALAEPSTVPAGIYAKQYLVAQKIWPQLAAKVIPTDNVRSALAAVESGNADAAIVYKTDALLSKRVRVAYEVPRAAGPKISYPFALLREAEQPVAAQKFYAHLRSKAALAVFARHGFIVP